MRIVNYKQGVYFIKTGDFVKIGLTTNVDSRLLAIETHNPFKTELLFVIPWLDNWNQVISKEEKVSMLTLERIVHYIFMDLKVKGEWFSLNVEVTDFIEDLQYQLEQKSIHNFFYEDIVYLFQKYGGKI